MYYNTLIDNYNFKITHNFKVCPLKGPKTIAINMSRSQILVSRDISHCSRRTELTILSVCINIIHESYNLY